MRPLVKLAQGVAVCVGIGVVTGIHYSPGWPFTAIARATAYWN